MAKVTIVVSSDEEKKAFSEFLSRIMGSNGTTIEIEQESILKKGEFRGTLKDINSFEEARVHHFPTVSELESFIMSKPNYSHTIHEVARWFLGHDLKLRKSSPEILKEYDKMFILLEKARRRVAMKQIGKWNKERTGEFRFGMPVRYTFESSLKS